MANGLTWEEETQARIKNARQRQMQVEQEYKRVGEEAKYLAEYVVTLERALELDRQHRGIKSNGQYVIDPEKLRKLSSRECLIEVANANNGLLVMTEAVSILVNADVFGDREHARSTLYATLSRSKRHFKRERSGVYRLIPKQKTLMG